VFLGYTYTVIIAAALIAVALALRPLQAPQENRVAKADRAKSASTPHNSDNSQTPPRAFAQNAAPSSEPATHANQTNANANTENDNTQWWIKIFTGVLAFVGVFQLVVMFLQWLTYRRQAGIMESQRGAMQGQLTTMNSQLAQMESAGKQTDAIIAQATEQAKAAQESVEIVISKERGRITLEPVVVSFPPTGINFLGLSYRVTIRGTTDVRIVSSEAKAIVTNSRDVPPRQDGMFWALSIPQWITRENSSDIHHHPIFGAGDTIVADPADISGLRDGTRFVHFWGTIGYQDIFGRPHTRTFRHIWKLDEFQSLAGLGRWHIHGPKEDNDDT
jgi:hypothetical protein